MTTTPHDVIAELKHVIRKWANHPHLVLPGPVDLSDSLANWLADALAADGWEIVKLPEPVSRKEPTEDENGWHHWPALRDIDDSFAIDGTTVYSDGEMHVNGLPCCPSDVACYAATLLAAAKHAEGQHE